MPVSVEFIRKLEKTPPELRQVLIDLLEEVERQREESVTKKDFLEFARQTKENFQKIWQAIKELAEAQKRTENRLNRLEGVVEELAEAQKRTEEEIKKLAVALKRTRQEVGGLAKSVAYALENEAFRKLPGFLQKEKGIEIIERIIRTEIKGEEINLFARGRRNGTPVVLVGESVLKLDDLSKLNSVMRKVEAVETEVEEEIVPIVITHFAKKKILDRAEKKGIIVVQSFQW